MVGRPSPGLHRAATRSSQGTDHLHLTISVFGLASRGAREYGAGRCLSVDGIRLAGAVLVASLGTDNLKYLYLLRLQEASQTGAEGACAFYSSVFQMAELTRPL